MKKLITAFVFTAFTLSLLANGIKSNILIVVPDSVPVEARIQLVAIQNQFIPPDEASDQINGIKPGSLTGQWAPRTNSVSGASAVVNNMTKGQLESVKIRYEYDDAGNVTATNTYGRAITQSDIDAIKAIHPDIQVIDTDTPAKQLKAWGWEEPPLEDL